MLYLDGIAIPDLPQGLLDEGVQDQPEGGKLVVLIVRREHFRAGRPTSGQAKTHARDRSHTGRHRYARPELTCGVVIDTARPCKKAYTPYLSPSVRPMSFSLTS